MMNENTDKIDQNIGSDDDDQSKPTENICEDLVNILQTNVTWSFENVERMTEEKNIMIKNIIEIAEHNLDEEVNGLKKVYRNLPLSK